MNDEKQTEELKSTRKYTFLHNKDGKTEEQFRQNKKINITHTKLNLKKKSTI